MANSTVDLSKMNNTIEENQNENQYIQTEKIKQSQEKPTYFCDLIPYKTEVLRSSKEAEDHPLYPFWNDQDKDLKNYRDHVAVSICIGVISVFSTITQLLFVIYGPEPYRWISLTFLIIGQIASFLGFCICAGYWGSQEYLNPDEWKCLLLCITCLFFPLCPIITPVSWYPFRPCSDHSKYYGWHNALIVTSVSSVGIAALQSYPQIIILTVMYASNDFDLNINSSAIVNWSFVAALLSVIALSIQIASIFEQRGVFLVNSIWLLFDGVLALTIICAIFYDETTLMVFYVDIGLYGVWMMMPIIAMLIGFIKIMFSEIRYCDCDSSTVLVCCCCFVCVVPIALCCSALLMSGAVIMTLFFVIPLSTYFNLFTFVWFFIMDQLYGWNVCPMSFRFGGSNGWNRYLLFEWVKNGGNVEERNDRLHSINMVILDNDKTLHAKYNQLCNDMVKNIRKSINSSEQSVHQMTSVIDRFFVLRFDIDGLKELKEDLGILIVFILKCAMIYFPINRILHFIIPFVIIIYIAFTVKWNIAELDPFLKVLFSLFLIFLILCIISIGIGWKSLNYHRLILPINHKRDGMDMSWNTYAVYVANCHYYVTALKVVADWCEDGGGDKYIAYVIVNLAGCNKVDSEDWVV